MAAGMMSNRFGRTQHFPALDGLRGIAALGVMVFHVGTVGGPAWLRSGYLSVDFFFILSGFVLSYAYNDKLLGEMSGGAFAAVRVIRLYPMMLFGIVLGFLLTEGLRLAPVPDWLVLPQMLLIPTTVTPKFYPFDGVQWTLALELVLNLVHGLVLRRLDMPKLLVGVVVAACALLLVSLHFGKLGVGWTQATWWGGVVRGIFGYGAGMLLYRLYAHGTLKGGSLPFWASTGLLLAAMGFCSHVDHFRWLTEFLCVAILFPSIVMFSLGTRFSGARLWMVLALGELSYPLYAVHGPVLEAWAKFAPQGQGLLVPLVWLVPVGIAITTAAAGFIVYDRPIRNWIMKLYRGRQVQAAAVQG